MTEIKIMGIVNVTPDSFSDGGKFYDAARAIEQGLKLISEGAEILDIGGESTRPNAAPVSIENEIARIVPVIEKLAETGTCISVDTRHAKTMRAALDAGATFINDINALRDDGALELAAEAGAEICLMHMQGTPITMQHAPQYEDVVEEVFSYLKGRIEACDRAGIDRDKIYADVGIGFGKTLDHNLELLKKLDRFHDLGVKLLLGTSRKNFIGIISEAAPPHERMGGSLASALWGVQKGVSVLRVHDVHDTRQAVNIWNALATE